jgi:hypothetical protein
MNLILRPLEDVNDVTWSIIWCLILLLGGTMYYIYTILKFSYQELKEDGQVRKQGQEGQHETKPGQRDCEES